MQRAVPADACGVGGSGRWTTLEVRILNWRREEAAQQLPAGLPATTPAQPSQTPVSHLVGVVVGGVGKRKATLSSFFLPVGCRDVGINHPGLVLLWHTGLSIYEETAST